MIKCSLNTEMITATWELGNADSWKGFSEYQPGSGNKDMLFQGLGTRTREQVIDDKYL